MATQASAVLPVVGVQEDVHVTGRRIVATIVDGLIFGALFTVMLMLFGTVTTIANVGPFDWNVSTISMPALPSLLYAVIVVLYYILLEGYLGQTFGKMVLGIKVVREDNGEVPGLGGATIRTLFRIVDGLFSYLVAFIAVLISGKNQRLGDMAAHTLVVRK
jgi:uncharacterized RDD family membrane protein YckC